MNDTELEQIKARCEAATPGPWEFDEKNIGYAHYKTHYGLLMNAEHDSKDYWLSVNIDYGMEHNADFITHARQDIPALIAEVRRLNERVKELETSTLDSVIKHLEVITQNDLQAENARLRDEIEGVWGSLMNRDANIKRLEQENARLRALLEPAERACKVLSEYMRSGEFFDPETSKAVREWQALKGGEG